MAGPVKGATLEDFKKLAEAAGSAIKETVTPQNIATAIAHPMDTLSKPGQALGKAIEDYRNGDLKERQKQYHDAAQNPDNSFAVRAGNSIREAGTIVEDKALQMVQDALQSEDLYLWKSNVKGVEDLFGKSMTVEYAGKVDRGDDKKKKDDEAELGSRSGASGDEATKGSSLLSAAASGPDPRPSPNPGLDPLEEDAAARVSGAPGMGMSPSSAD